MLLENIKGKTAVLIDGLTKYEKPPSLDSYFKTVFYIIKNSKAIYEPNQVFNEEQILKVLVGSLEERL